MKVLRGSPLLPLVLLHGLSSTAVLAQQAYDVIVVGSGPGGLVAAEYLSRDASVSVLILEAGLPSLAASGGSDGPGYAAAKGWTKFDIPGEYDSTIYNSANEKYRVDWITGPYMWLGKLVGGCSSINAALYFRPSDDYVTSSKWPFSPARVASLLNENEQIHGVRDAPSPDGKHYNQEAYNIVANAFTSKLGYSEKASLNDAAARNAKSKSFGHAPYAIKNGLRDSPATAFWGKMKNRPNVKLVTSAMVDYVQQAKGKASGVVYNGNVQVPLTARGAVILAAGALSTPKVLIQSGIGPVEQLNLLNGRNDFPGVKASNANGGWATNANVGKHLFDTNVVFASFSHPQMRSFQYKNAPQAAIDQFLNQGQTGPWASAGPVLIGYETFGVNGRAYDFQTTVLTAGFGSFYQNSNAFTTALYVNNPEARAASGFSGDGKWNAFAQGSAYYGTSNDLAAMQSYATRVVNALQSVGATFLSAANGESVADWVASSSGLITHHFGGSCYASSDAGDTKRCADDKLRVLGTSNVFVGDGSAMRDGTVNPYGFIMYIGREVGEQVQKFLANGPSPPPVGTCSIENGVDYVGNDLGNVPGATAEACCSLCQSSAGCNAFSWTSFNGGTCWLKSAKTTTKADASVRSATVSSAPPPTTAPPTTPPPSGSCAIESDIDYPGNDLDSALSGTAEGCCTICSARSGCAAFTWTNYNGGTCWLKSAKGSTVAKSGARSSVVAAPPPPPSQCSAIENNVDYAGNDVGSAPSASVDGCCGLCGQRSGCGAFTWSDYNGGTCWLKSGKGTATAKNGVKSAVYNGGSPACTLVDGFDYYGNDVGSAASSTAAGCCAVCRTKAGCKAFTWTNQDGGTCWLKSLQGSAIPKPGAVSGKV